MTLPDARDILDCTQVFRAAPKNGSFTRVVVGTRAPTDFSAVVHRGMHLHNALSYPRNTRRAQAESLDWPTTLHRDCEFVARRWFYSDLGDASAVSSRVIGLGGVRGVRDLTGPVFSTDCLTTTGDMAAFAVRQTPDAPRRLDVMRRAARRGSWATDWSINVDLTCASYDKTRDDLLAGTAEGQLLCYDVSGGRRWAREQRAFDVSAFEGIVFAAEDEDVNAYATDSGSDVASYPENVDKLVPFNAGLCTFDSYVCREPQVRVIQRGCTRVVMPLPRRGHRWNGETYPCVASSCVAFVSRHSPIFFADVRRGHAAFFGFGFMPSFAKTFLDGQAVIVAQNSEQRGLIACV